MRSLLAVAVLVSLAVPARAEGGAAARLSLGLKTWFKHVKEGLAESSVGGYRQKAHITAVAAVRGEEQSMEDPSVPVWKSAADGKKSKALRAQRAELSAAVDEVLAGRLDQGRAKLDAFDKAHPESLLASDVKEIRAKLDEAAAAQAEETAAAEKQKQTLHVLKMDAPPQPK